ncbi:hypothetical protein [Neobacillus mesonae]|uniref:hypothetical protein n=1 Tax=Neobacillus mesonae TaxID=1193713 RepID=UPI0020404C1E|nr:hypothetical protein [Neobacillus mesonae]MCM3569401.1 hypothetical protein [Neobacillus mesonae]
MKKEEIKLSPDNALFFEIVKKAYEKGRNNKEVTLEEIMEELKTDLRNLMIG